MADLTVEGIHPVLLTITGKFDVYQVDPTDPVFISPNPRTAIQAKQAWGIVCEFKQEGWMIPLINPAATWRGQLLLEKKGKNEFIGFDPGEGVFESNFVPIIGHTYTQKIECKPEHVPTGVYGLSLLMQLYSADGKPVPLVAQGDFGRNVTVYP